MIEQGDTRGKLVCLYEYTAHRLDISLTWLPPRLLRRDFELLESRGMQPDSSILAASFLPATLARYHDVATLCEPGQTNK